MFDIDNFAGKFPAKNSLSIAHSIDDFLMPHCFTRIITNVENFRGSPMHVVFSTADPLPRFLAYVCASGGFSH